MCVCVARAGVVVVAYSTSQLLFLLFTRVCVYNFCVHVVEVSKTLLFIVSVLTLSAWTSSNTGIFYACARGFLVCDTVKAFFVFVFVLIFATNYFFSLLQRNGKRIDDVISLDLYFLFVVCLH